jgi:hypothetical protein
MPTFEFTVRLRGSGEDERSAWLNAVEAFSEDPGVPEEAFFLDNTISEDHER